MTQEQIKSLFHTATRPPLPPPPNAPTSDPAHHLIEILFPIPPPHTHTYINFGQAWPFLTYGGLECNWGRVCMTPPSAHFVIIRLQACARHRGPNHGPRPLSPTKQSKLHFKIGTIPKKISCIIDAGGITYITPRDIKFRLNESGTK